MFRDLQGRFECYQILYDQALRQTNPVVREAMLASFQEFKEIVRAKHKREWEAEKEMAKSLAELEQSLREIAAEENSEVEV